MSVTWSDIPGFEGKYQCSTAGDVASLNYHREKKRLILKQFRRSKTSSYLCVSLCKDGTAKQYSVHRLVAITFIANPENLPEVNHKDENPLNNEVSNLEWCNRTYNNVYGTRTIRAGGNISKAKSKPVTQYTLDACLVKTWPSAREINKKLGLSASVIGKCCRGIYRQAYGFKWSYSSSQASSVG